MKLRADRKRVAKKGVEKKVLVNVPEQRTPVGVASESPGA
jgi:hypothetical protein